MTVGLTDRQRQLFQEDKHILIDTIIILEDKLLRAIEEIKHLNNEMLLDVESLSKKAEELANELETERICRVKAEQAHIKAQEEIDVINKDNSSDLDSDEFRHKLDTMIRKYYDSIKECEEGENGVL